MRRRAPRAIRPPSALSLLLLLLLSALAVRAADDAATASAEPAARKEPWEVRLSLTPSGQLSLHWLSRAAEPEAVEISEWGATGTVQRVGAAAEASEALDGVHSRHAIFPALRPGGSYIYRLPGDGPAVPFRAPRHDAPAVSVLALADMGTWGSVLDVVRSLGRALEGELLLHLGDLSYAQDAATWDKWADLMAPALRSRPALFVPGNWDAKAFAWPAFTHRFYSPLLADAPATYRYSFAYQRMRFVMLNSYEAYADGSEQHRWLAEELRAADAPERRRQQPWLIVCFHSPMYSSSSGHGGGDEAFRKALEPLLLAHHVDLCLSGHDHGYERSLPVRDHAVLPARGPVFAAPVGAPIHLLVGTAGATHDPWLEPAPAWSAYREAAHGYTRLRSFAANSSLLVELVRTNDTVADRFWLVRGGGGGGGGGGAAATAKELAEPHEEGWLALLPSGPFLAVLLAGLALPALVLVRYVTHQRHREPYVYATPIRRNSSFLIQRLAS